MLQVYFCGVPLSYDELLWKYTSMGDLSFLESWIQSKNCKKRKRSPPVCMNDSEWTNEHTKEFQNCRIHTIKANLLFLFLFVLDRKKNMKMDSFLDCDCFRRLKSSLSTMKHKAIFSYFIFFSGGCRRLIYFFSLIETEKMTPHFLYQKCYCIDKANNGIQPFVSILIWDKIYKRI